MLDWLLITTLLAMVALNWLSELLPRRERAASCSEFSLDIACARRTRRSSRTA